MYYLILKNDIFSLFLATKQVVKQLFLYIIFGFFGALITNAQNRSFSFQHYGPEEGLSNANVFAIKQNKNHLLYMATENGVYNFDGYNFNKIKPKTPLKSNFIRNIGFDANNNLIIVNRREGIYEYNKASNEANLIKNLNFKNSVDELIFDSLYNYSLTDQIAVTAIEKTTGKIIEDDIKKAQDNNQAFAIFKTSEQHILIGRSDGLYQFVNGKQQKINLGKSFTVYSITEDLNGLIYLGTDNAIYCIENNKIKHIYPVKAQKTFTFFAANNIASVSKIIVDKYQRIWFTNTPDDNLYVIENNITYNVFDLLGIDKVLINCIFKDSDDHIWLGTFNDGVYFIQNPLLQNISFSSGRKNSSVTTASFIENNIAVGTDNGFYIFDYKNNNTQTVIEPDDLFGEKIYGIYPIGKNIIYSKNNSAANTKKAFLINNVSYNFNPIASRLLQYKQNSTEAYMADGLANLYLIKNYDSEKYKIIDTLISFPDYRTKINSILDDTKGNLFVGTSDGLTVYSLKNDNYKNYKNQVFSFGINHIEQFQQKTYIAHENGITVFEDTTYIQQVGEQRLTAVKKIKFYQNKIWIATLDGLFICDEKFNPIVVYNKSNGLLSNTINDIVFNGNNCCICTNKGITLCSIDDLLKQERTPNKLFITSIDIDDEKTTFGSNTIELTSTQSDVIINFSSPLFVKPNKQFFRYKFNKGKWLNLENMLVHLTAIEGGNHNVDIISSYDGINWSEPVSISIKKEIPFKQTVWFIVCIILGALIVILSVTIFWVKQVRNKATRRVQEDRQVNLLKHQAMNSLMSPHFIFNSLTSIQNYINSNDPLKASEYLAKFSRLIRMIIEKASQGDIVLHEELTRLNYYLDLEKERFKGKFDFHLEVGPNVNTFDIKIPNMIIQPYAENSIIHGILPKHEHGNLFIKFKKADETTLIILIEDDGIGFNKAKENAKAGHKSLGTKTIENILELNTKLTGKKQKVEIIDKSTLTPAEQGTRITITLQIN